jgi:hypothetical protein
MTEKKRGGRAKKDEQLTLETGDAGADKPAKKSAAKKASAPAKKPAPKKASEKAPAKKAPAKSRGKKAEPAAVEAAAPLEHFAPPPEEPPHAHPIDEYRDPLDDEDEDVVSERMHHTVEVLEGKASEDEGSAPEEDEDDPGAEPSPAPLSPEEEELSQLYGDELGAPALAATEFRDARTSDEDRPMVPEINAREERHKRWEDRRKKRKERQDQRRAERDQRREQHQGRPPRPAGQGDDRPDRPREDRPERPRDERPALPALPAAAAPAAGPTNGSNGHGEEEHVVHRVGNTLGDAAWQVFHQLRSNQPLPVKQLAAMMRKRGLLDVDPDQAWPHLKAALIGDERSYRQLGLRPRIVYRGRDLFGVGPVAASLTSQAETSLAKAMSQLAVATHNALKDRVGRASPAGFERLVHAYLVSTGYQDIEWVKRVGGISYATALPPDGSSPILVSARSGDAPVDRRGVGELRVGVEAKQMLAGLLLATRELSEDAERELVRPGRSIMVLCGDAFIGALIGAGVGVVTSAAPLRYVDDQLLDELLAG